MFLWLARQPEDSEDMQSYNLHDASVTTYAHLQLLFRLQCLQPHPEQIYG